jgi:DNA-binding NtrC family response regulator
MPSLRALPFRQASAPVEPVPDACNVPTAITSERATLPLKPERDPAAPLVLHLPGGELVPLDRPLTIGQSRRCDVVLRDPRVSREHCGVEPDAGGVRVRDLGSTNGTFVNGVRVDTAELRAGSLLDLGGTRLRVARPPVGARLVGASPAMAELHGRIQRLAHTSMPILICGETGTGKELVAQALHDGSGRSGAFVPVNCGSIPKELVESELFGHERGAFTGALTRRAGVFEEASGGTLFLDEIGELPLSLQTRLLRALESRRVRPVGSNREIAVDVRVVAATHVDVRAAVRAGRFRADLFYRLGTDLPVPPLRERRGDIPLLAAHFLDELGPEAGRATLSQEAIPRLEAHAWPGNVRELKHVLHRALLLSDGVEIQPQDLVFPRPQTEAAEEQRIRVEGRSYLEIEKDVLRWAFRHYEGNRTAAAQALGIPKSTLCDKVKRYRIDFEPRSEEEGPR